MNSEMAVDLSPEKKPSSEYQLLWVLAGDCQSSRLFYKLDTNLHFTESSSTPNYVGRTKATRPPELSTPNSPFSVGRFSRHSHLRVCSSSGKAKTKLKNSPSRPVLPPLLPQPDTVSTPYPDLPSLPAYTAVAALGSKIYVIGGSFSCKPLKSATDLPRDVFAYDTRFPGSPPQISSQLNCGKSWPKACTINGKIYVIPHSFAPTPFAGRYFECFDPLSDSWTILPDPPFDCHMLLDVMSHVVVGSHLLISIQAGVYRFDTSRPDRGWKKIILSLQHSPPLELDYLPFTYRFSLSCSLREDLLLSQVTCDGAGDHVFAFLTKTLKLRERDLYVCSFDDMDALSDPETELVRISIKPVIGMSRKNLKWEKFAKYASVPSLSRIEDGVVMYANHGFEDPNCKVGLYYGFDMLRIERVLKQEGEYDYKASSISCSLFRAKDPLRDKCGKDSLSVLVINKDGNFSS